MQTPLPAPQPAVPQPPAPPAPPGAPAPLADVALPSATTPFAVSIQNLPIPRTGQELTALRARQEMLGSQLTSASGRREELARQLRNADADAREGIQQRLDVLDQRIVQLETDLAVTGRALASAPAGLVAETRMARNDGPDPELIIPVAVPFTLFVLAPVAVAYARRIWKRTGQPVAVPPQLTEQAQRMERMEQAVDAIAIEVERISENQRFLTRLMTETPALGGQRAGEPARAARDAG